MNLPSFGFQRSEQLNAVARQHGQVVAGTKGSADPGGMPRGATGQAIALQQDNVVGAALSQVIGDAEADGAAADDDGLRCAHWTG